MSVHPIKVPLTDRAVGQRPRAASLAPAAGSPLPRIRLRWDCDGTATTGGDAGTRAKGGFMGRSRKRRGSAAVTVTAAVLGGLLVAPPPAHAAEAPLCHLGVIEPFFNNGREPQQSWIVGEG